MLKTTVKMKNSVSVLQFQRECSRRFPQEEQVEIYNQTALTGLQR
jgi:hypothetical protein